MEPRSEDAWAAVVGLGYVGLPLAASLASTGLRVVGVETNAAVREAVQAGSTLKFEPGLQDLLRSLPEGALTVAGELPASAPDAVIICVGTAVDEQRRADLSHLTAAVDAIAERIDENTVVVVRSTVAIGTCRNLVLPRLRRRVAEPLLAFCPERTIQGSALSELRELPQIISGLDDRSVRRAAALFEPIAAKQVPVSSLEAAEAIKLICNAHTDLIYGFGNEVALIAHGLGLDADELIASANLGYPRPDLSKPGFVGGSCLVKDPYLLIDSSLAGGYRPVMVEAARAVNERVPAHVAQIVERAIAASAPPAGAKVMVGGIAYKGSPPTDDTRGSAAADLALLLGGRVRSLVGHDFLVEPARIRALGYEPAGLEEGLRGADALVLLTDHPGYRDLDADRLLALMNPDPVVFDMWGLLRGALAAAPGLRYLGLSRG